MSTEPPMRERIALALATAIDHQTEWDSLTLEQEGWIFQLADAVLDAMREPTGAQLEAMQNYTKSVTLSGSDACLGGKFTYAACFAAAIDAAKEGK